MAAAHIARIQWTPDPRMDRQHNRWLVNRAAVLVRLSYLSWRSPYHSIRQSSFYHAQEYNYSFLFKFKLKKPSTLLFDTRPSVGNRRNEKHRFIMPTEANAFNTMKHKMWHFSYTSSCLKTWLLSTDGKQSCTRGTVSRDVDDTLY